MPTRSKRILATIMFTDMVGYTALMQEDEALARKKRKRHREVFDHLHEKYGGQVIQYFGDGTLSIFDSSVEAVGCAIEMQQLLKAPIEVPVRIGIHTGDIILEEDNILGDAVNLASRIESFAVPEAVFISDAVHDQIKNQPQFQFTSLGLFELKNVNRPFEIFALANENLVVPDPKDLQGKGRFQKGKLNNLPKALTSFLGRKKEIDDIRQLLQNHQLITLTGPGGTGKTRLSIQVAQEVANQFMDGIFWVPLAAETEVELVAFTIAKHLGIKENVALSIEEGLIQFFEEKKSLLILDNFEQIMGAAQLVERLTRSCEQLHILVSSRIILQVSGEQEYQVSPLNLPKLNASNTVDRLAGIPSVALFVERAKATRRNFELNERNAETVAEICIKLDGLPLAIELAAARTKIFKPKTLLDRLTNSLDVLKGGRQFPERHQTLRQTIAWSYDLLDQEEQELFRRMSIFVGSSSLEAIEEVCGQNGLAHWDVVDGVMALVDKSLLQTEEEEDSMRFFMLETIREFAKDELKESPQKEKLKKGHIQYYLKIAEEGIQHLSGEDAYYWNALLHKEQPNFRAAIDYSIELNEMSLAYRLGLALRPFWGSRGMTIEGIQQLEKIVEVKVPEALREEKLKVMQNLGMLYFYVPFFEKAKIIFEESLAFWRKQKNQHQIGLVLNDLGWACIILGELNDGEKYSIEAQTIFESLNNKDRLAASINNLGWVYAFRNIPKKALPYFQNSLAITKEIKDWRRHAYALLNLGWVNLQLGNYQLAEEQIKKGIETHQKNSDKVLIGWGHQLLGMVYITKGDSKACEKLAPLTEKIGREVNARFVISGGLGQKAFAAFANGQLELAQKWIEEALKFAKMTKAHHWIKNILTRKIDIAMSMGEVSQSKVLCRELIRNEINEGNYSGFLPGLERIARIAMEEGKYEQAATLFYSTQRIREESGTPLYKSEEPIYKTLTDRLQNELGEEKIEHIKTQHFNNQELHDLAIKSLQ